MILPKQQANAIATGRKTTHHTMWDTLTLGSRQRIAYRVSKNEIETTCHIEITAVEKRELRTLDRFESKAEGFDGARGPLNFKRAWLLQHDQNWTLKQEATTNGLTDELVAQRFLKHTGRTVHVLTLKLAEEPDRYMAPSSGRQTRNQTTTNPRDAIDELPVPPQAFVDAEAKRIYELSQTTRAQARRAEAADRFAFAEARAREAGIDTRRAARSVQQIAAALERRIPRHEAM